MLFADLIGSTALSSRLDPEEMREVLYMGRLHSTWATDILDGKKIPEAAKWSAQIQLDEDKETLDTIIRMFEALYGKLYR